MVDHLDRDRRQLQRFQLRAPAIIKSALEDKETVSELYTRDICSGGAFFQTDQPLPTGIGVEVTLFLLISASREWEELPRSVKVTTDGMVVRSEGDGMAVAFSEQYQMAPVPA
jgi:Tfp pilus assembly protein PilZ